VARPVPNVSPYMGISVIKSSKHLAFVYVWSRYAGIMQGRMYSWPWVSIGPGRYSHDAA